MSKIKLHKIKSYRKAKGFINFKLTGSRMTRRQKNDLESAFNIVNDFSDFACVIIKHANPCGFGIGNSLISAYDRAVSADPVSYFGGIVAFNGEVDEELASQLVKPFLECVIAPSFSMKALSVFKVKKNLRVITLSKDYNKNKLEIKSS